MREKETIKKNITHDSMYYFLISKPGAANKIMKKNAMFAIGMIM